MRCCLQQPASQPNTLNFSSQFLKKWHCFEACRKTVWLHHFQRALSTVTLPWQVPKKFISPGPYWLAPAPSPLQAERSAEQAGSRLPSAHLTLVQSEIPVWGWARQQARGPHMCNEGFVGVLCQRWHVTVHLGTVTSAYIERMGADKM